MCDAGEADLRVVYRSQSCEIAKAEKRVPDLSLRWSRHATGTTETCFAFFTPSQKHAHISQDALGSLPYPSPSSRAEPPIGW